MIRSIRKSVGLGFLALAGLAGAQTTDYKTLHNLLIQYYGYQRAGDKTIDNKNPFYNKSPFPHSTDAISGQDLSSGWYDAGDFVKFGLNEGFSVYCLLKGYDVFPRGYDDATSWDYKAADQIPDILGEVKIATDYLQRAVVSATQIVVDVGNAGTDHQAISEDGYTNSNRTSPRTTYTAGGADVAGLYAASLALMSKLYKQYDATYSAACLAKAKLAFQYGVANQKLSTQQNNGEFYKTTTWKDKMACGGVELFRATGDSAYLTQAKTFLAGVVQHYYALGYANAGDLAAFELKRLGVPNADGIWLSDVSFAMSHVVTAASASNLIKGAFINTNWGNPGNAGCAGFSAALAFMTTGDTKYLTFARNQAHWVAGIAPFGQSYIVGYGTNAPTAPHHRNDVARLNGVRLKGGVVAGPYPAGGTFDLNKPEASSWSFNGSDAGNYQNTETAINYNAGMVGLVAFLRDYDNPPTGMIRIATPLSATPGNADLNTGKVTISGALESAATWKIVLTGKISGAKKTLTGSAAAISATWGGEADSGSFVAGEGVEVKLDMPSIAPYHLGRATTSFNIAALKLEAFKTTDIKVEDFEDGDTVNTLLGTWKVFNDKPTGTSSTNPAALPAAIITGEGYGATKGLGIRLIGSAGATRPFVGVKTTFNAAGTAVSLGATAVSVVFDILSAAGSSVWVEFEQSDITDGAYFGKKIDFANASWNRIRIPLASLAQPEWKTTTKTFNPGSVTSLRFTYYGTSSVRFSLDNIHIDGLKISGVAVHPKGSNARSTLGAIRAGRGGLHYFFQPPIASAGDWKAEVLDAFGRTLDARNLGKIGAGQSVDFTGLHLGPGWYFLRHSVSGTAREFVHRIYVKPEGN